MRRSSKTARRVAWCFGLAIFCGAILLGYWRSSSSTQSSSLSQSAQPALGTVGTANPHAISPSQPRAARHKLAGNSVDDHWKKFQNAFGNQLNATFTDDHRIANIRSGDTPAKPASGFESGNQDEALQRAESILHQAGDLIGLNPAFPLATPHVRSDEVSSQIEWVQTYDGVPIEPFGRITVQLDQQGGLRGLYSNYISDPSIGNEPSMSAGDAKDTVVSELPFKPAHPEQIAQGQLVLFAAGPQDSASAVDLRYAYRFFIEGREVVTDASTGKILSERDRRQY